MRFVQLVGTGVLCGFSVVVALLAGEWMVRYLAPQKLYRFPQGMFENHPTLQYRLSPHFTGVAKTVEFETHIRINGLGLRAAQDYERKGPKTFRILMLGDSFAMGVGVDQDETYGQVLARRLVERVAESSSVLNHYEVINAGVPGYNTFQALTYLRESGLALEPDLVVLGFYIGNDVAENFAVPSVSVQHGYLQSGGTVNGFLPASLRRYLALHSHLYQLIWPLQRRLLNPSRWMREEQERLQRRLAIYEVDPGGPDSENLWRTTEQSMAEMAALTLGQGVPFVVVVIPERVQVERQAWESLIEPREGSGTTYRIDWPNQRVVAIGRELGLPVLDLLPVFTQATAGEPLYLKLDGHWTRRGHEIAAEALEAFLRHQRLMGQVVR